MEALDNFFFGRPEKVTCGTMQITDLNKMSLMIKSGVFRTVFLKKCSGVVANETRTDRQSAEREISDGEVLLGFFRTVTYKTPKEWLRTTIPTYSVSFPLHLR
ncbi:hypothetical protein GRJ2_001404700 [Grus japonensis]|uniref:Uncharacterized protein n=1 Tax=Grus japonensis TaxID=30415 RepID=A0ABC9WVH5_GRUJA